MFSDPHCKPLTEVQKNLYKAANLVRERGLAKDFLEKDDGAMCIHGAINMAVRGDAHKFARDTIVGVGGEEKAILNYLRKHNLHQGDRTVQYGQWGQQIFLSDDDYCCIWNNADGRTAEEVISALEGAAREAT